MGKKNILVSKLFLLLILLSVTGKAEIIVETNSVTGNTRVYTVTTISKNPLVLINFEKSDNKHWVRIRKVGGACWFFKDFLSMRINEKTYDIKASESNFDDVIIGERCSTNALFQVDTLVDEAQTVEFLIVTANFWNLDSISTWLISKEVLEEWKNVINYDAHEKKDTSRVLNETIKKQIFKEEHLSLEIDSISTDKALELIKGVFPKFPDAAKKDGTWGKVEIAVLVDKNGKVRKAKIVKRAEASVGFEEAVLREAYQRVYKPYKSNKKAVARWVYDTMEFKTFKPSPTKK